VVVVGLVVETNVLGTIDVKLTLSWRSARRVTNSTHPHKISATNSIRGFNDLRKDTSAEPIRWLKVLL
jgi:hypothetical protein